MGSCTPIGKQLTTTTLLQVQVYLVWLPFPAEIQQILYKQGAHKPMHEYINSVYNVNVKTVYHCFNQYIVDRKDRRWRQRSCTAFKQD